MGRKCDRIGWNVTESDGIDWVFVIICDMTVTGWDGMECDGVCCDEYVV